MGGGGCGVPNRELAGRTCRPRRTRDGARKSFGSGLPRNICGRRHLRVAELGWKARPGRRSRGKANGGLCCERNQGARGGGFSAAAIHLPPSGQPSNNRPQQRGGGFRLDGALWLDRLAGVERRAYFFPDWLPLPHRRALDWLWAYVTFRRGARIILAETAGAAANFRSAPQKVE